MQPSNLANGSTPCVPTAAEREWAAANVGDTVHIHPELFN